MTIRGTLFAVGYDRQMRKIEQATLGAIRSALIPRATGNVLEIGAGTGVNLDYYGAVDAVALVEPEPPLVRKLERRAKESPLQVSVLRAPAEDIPFEDGTFDTVVSTLVLCTVGDQPRALREARRVLRPRGQLLFIEHLRSLDPRVAKIQDRFNWVNRAVAGCECNRPTLDTIAAAGFDITESTRFEPEHVPPFVRPWVWGAATATAARVATTASTTPASTTAHSTNH